MRIAIGLLVLALAAPLGACREVEETTRAGYEPSHTETVAGADVVRVTLTREGAQRVALETAPVQRRGDRSVIPYAALLYDGQGKAFVYVAHGQLTFVREPVEVARVEGGEVVLAAGPDAGARVVTVGATEVYGTELGIGGGH